MTKFQAPSSNNFSEDNFHFHIESAYSKMIFDNPLG